jgi:hypothetical protein
MPFFGSRSERRTDHIEEQRGSDGLCQENEVPVKDTRFVDDVGGIPVHEQRFQSGMAFLGSS